MPLSLSNRDQNSGHLFYNRRLRAATTRFSVRMRHDDRKQTAAIMLSVVLVLIGMGWMMLLNVLRPAGIVRNSAIVGDRDSGALYARIDGRLYPALNMTSARLAVGNPAAPTWVRPAEVARYPTGPLIGIPGAPAAMPVSTAGPSAWAVCDSTSSHRGDPPVVTAIAGPLGGTSRAAPLPAGAAVLARFGTETYAIWGGRRSRVELADRAVTLSLGIDPGVQQPIPMSRALHDALPSTEPLTVPDVPGAGEESTWLPGYRVGTVITTRTAAGTGRFYALLADGVQQIGGFVADLLRNANSYGQPAPPVISPDKLIDVPEVSTLPVGYYPNRRLDFVDSAASPTTCVGWERARTDPQARVTVFNGRGLPTPESADERIVSLVRDDRSAASVVADRVLMLPGATDFVVSTAELLDAGSRETLFWLSPNGVRFGIAGATDTLQALGLDPATAQQAPWPLLRCFAAGPELSRQAALVARDTLTAGGSVAAVPGRSPTAGH